MVFEYYTNDSRNGRLSSSAICTIGGRRNTPLGKLQEGTEHANITDLLTNGITTSVKQQPSAIPAVFALGQNFPNPFNPTIQRSTLRFLKLGYVTLKVYNILGQEVATLFSGVQQIGNHTAVFDGSRFASGVYFYRLEAGNNTMTKKLVLMK